MPLFSNIDQVSAWLDEVIEDISFDIPGPNTTFGYDSGVAIAEGIQERSFDGQHGTSKVWPENTDTPPYYYKSTKLKEYGTDKTNYRTTQMLSMGSLTANMESTDGGETFVMTYGTGEPPSSSLTGHLDESDTEKTDKEKAAIAHLNGRPFFELDQDIVSARVMPIARESLGKYLQDKANH